MDLNLFSKVASVFMPTAKPSSSARKHVRLDSPVPSKKSRASYYLPHLDGFRVLALAGVLLFHFDIPGATGGFIGVDCFLVLSGFLITRNILRSLREDTFSFRDFYVRRFWRLYPASFAVAFATVIIAVLAFPPDLSKAAVLSALASSSLVSNIHFLYITDYFDDGAHLKPLLHTWSLSLEEQYYLLWPILLWSFITKFPNHRGKFCAALLVLSGLSVALSYALQRNHPSFVFFMLPTRVFEFGIGAICALTEPNWQSDGAAPSLVRRGIETLISVISVSVVSASYFHMPQQAQPHHVLVVLLATALLIVTPNSLLCKYIFGARVLRVLGSMTYSAYLTHWPIYVFARYISGGVGKATPHAFILTLATFGSAALMQFCIENPLRKKRSKYLAPFVGSFVIFVMVCLGTWTARGMGYHFNEETVDQVNFQDMCVDYGLKAWPGKSYGCEVGDRNGRHSNITVIGDSYTIHLISAYDVIGKRKGLRFSFLFCSGCPLQPMKYPKQGAEKCWDFEARRWEIIKGRPVNGTRVVPQNGTVILSHWMAKNDVEKQRRNVKGIYADITRLGYKMILSGPPPGMEGVEKWRFSCIDLRNTALLRFFNLLSLSGAGGRDMCVDERMEGSGFNALITNGHRKILEEEDLPGLTFIDFNKELCDESGDKLNCRTPWDFDRGDRLPEVGYRRDGHHLTIPGSEFLAPFVEKHLPL